MNKQAFGLGYLNKLAELSPDARDILNSMPVGMLGGGLLSGVREYLMNMDNPEERDILGAIGRGGLLGGSLAPLGVLGYQGIRNQGRMGYSGSVNPLNPEDYTFRVSDPEEYKRMGGR